GPAHPEDLGEAAQGKGRQMSRQRFTRLTLYLPQQVRDRLLADYELHRQEGAQPVPPGHLAAERGHSRPKPRRGLMERRGKRRHSRRITADEMLSVGLMHYYSAKPRRPHV